MGANPESSHTRCGERVDSGSGLRPARNDG